MKRNKWLGRLCAGAALMTSGLFLAGSAVSAPASGPTNDFKGWADFEQGPEASHYSALSQINRSNVSQLKMAWTYDVGKATMNAEPLLAEGHLIVAGSDSSIVALDPSSGKEVWRTPGVVGGGRMRGFTYWRSKDGTQSRILFAAYQKLRALDAKTGAVIKDFAVDLRDGLIPDSSKITRIQSGTPGRIFGDLIVMGSSPGEDYGSPPGDIRAYNLLTGKLAWTFHTIPHPGEKGYETWPKDAWTRVGGANDWGGLSLDTKRGIVYVVTGAPTYDFYGVDRIGMNLFSNCLIALDARTGKLLWYFQDVHHDLWDYDLTTSPTLFSMKQGGKMVDAVGLSGKTGFLFVFDRVTGKAIWPIIERKAPKSDMPGEQAWPTQPFPTKIPPFARQSLTAADLDPTLPPDEIKRLTDMLNNARNEGLYTPPSTRNTVQMPGNQGGANWGMSGAEPTSGRFFVESFDIPAVLKLVTGPDPTMLEFARMSGGGAGAAPYIQNCALCHGADRKGQAGVPALEGIGSRLSLDQIKATIREGKGPMPSFPNLKQADVDAIAAYLTSNGRGAPPAAAAAGSPVGIPEAEGPVAPRPAAAKPIDDGVLRYHSGYGFQISSKGSPIIAPPWQTITAYDLQKGVKLWQIPIGSVPGHDKPTGMAFSKGGFAITAGKLLFAASAGDQMLHAWDSETGKLLWEAKLPSVPEGQPAIYEAGGKQYIALPVASFTGRGILPNMPTPAEGRNSYVAFSLP
jgi:quinoprotein glucose dehydrogenase